MSLRPFNGVVAAATAAGPGVTKFDVSGNFCYVRSTTGELLITLREGRNGATGRDLVAKVPTGERQAVETATGDTFDQIVVENSTASDVTFTLIAGAGHFDAPLSQVSLEGPNDIGDADDVDVDHTAATLVLAADANRRRAYVGSHPNNDQFIRVGAQATVAAGRGFCLQPGIGIPIEGTGAIYAIAEAEGVSFLNITTENRV